MAVNWSGGMCLKTYQMEADGIFIIFPSS